MRSVYFAHLTDIHISDSDESWGPLATQAESILRNTFARLDVIPDLDFVLISGDVLDNATQAEVAVFTGALRTLGKPWHYIPGNHDGFYDPEKPGAYAPHEAVPQIDPRMASPVPHAQEARWSREVKPGVQLIGLDSRLPDDWAGEVNAGQMAWLKAELDAAREKLVILTVHHPLHPLHPRDNIGWFTKFFASNGEEVERLLDGYPNVRLVLSGHHHAHRLICRPGRLHLNTAALTGYPCLYRLVRISEADGGWHVEATTEHAAEEDARPSCPLNRS